MTVVPFLTVEERVKYLYDREYFAPGTITDQHRTRLSRVNFHYFLGYARNYRALVGRGQVQVSVKHPADVFRVIDLDTKASCLIHEGLRNAEWRLRAAVVERYCEKFPSANSFLQDGQYRVTDPQSPARMVESILEHIFRHDEPYVSEQLREASVAMGVRKPRRYAPEIHQTCLDLAAGLPLWSVVDSFSLGLLGQFLMSCDSGEGTPVWKKVAHELGISAQVFETQVKSLAFLRNAVAHHARLWMRPTSDSAKKPRAFDKKLRGVHPKSMYWAVMNLATFLPSDASKRFVERFDEFTREFAIYRHGITNVHEAHDGSGRNTGSRNEPNGPSSEDSQTDQSIDAEAAETREENTRLSAPAAG